jgi:mono/diheme cytochrome c family protein
LVLGSAVLTAASIVGLAHRWDSSESAERANGAAQAEPQLAELPPENDTLLRDIWGNRRQLSELAGVPATVLVFLSCDCPLSNRAAPVIARLARDHDPTQVQVVGLFPQTGDSLGRMAAHALEFDLPITVWRDGDGVVARQLGIERVPSAVLLDGELRVRYRGAVADLRGGVLRSDNQEPSNLEQALDAVLEGRAVERPVTSVDGCLLERPRNAPRGEAAPSYEEVAAILRARCVECHTAGGGAPFELGTHEQAVRWSAMIREVVLERRMPPWHPDPEVGRLSHERYLSDAEVRTIAAWVEADCPGGKELTRELAAPPRAEPYELKLAVDAPIEVPAQGTLEYQYRRFVAPEGSALAERGGWLRGGRLKPTSPEVVHHQVAFFVRKGAEAPPKDYRGVVGIIGWAPGDLSFELPEESAIWIPPGAQIVFEGHYTPNGRAASDRPELELDLVPTAPQQQVYIAIQNQSQISIPPRVADWRGEVSSRFPSGAKVLALFPHMHLRGKAMQYQVEAPAGERSTVLSVPRYDFYWQTFYWFAEPLHLKAGSRLHTTAHWDNSRLNLRNPDPNVTVGFGEQSSAEMMTTWVVYADAGESPFATNVAPPVITEE